MQTAKWRRFVSPVGLTTNRRSLIIPADLHGEYAFIIFYRGAHGVVQEENVHIVALPVYSLDQAREMATKVVATFPLTA